MIAIVCLMVVASNAFWSRVWVVRVTANKLDIGLPYQPFLFFFVFYLNQLVCNPKKYPQNSLK